MTKLTPKTQALIELARKNHAERLTKLAEAAASRPGAANSLQDRTVIRSYGDSIAADQAYARQRAAGVTNSHLLNKTTAAVFTNSNTFTPTIAGFDYNDKQLEAIERAMRGQSFCLIGAAGTGKTTTTREIIGQLVKLPHISPLEKETKYLRKGTAGIVVISFTNKAVNNLKRYLPQELKEHCLTYHKLLEYGPVWYEEGGGKKTMRFEPSFNLDNKLPHISCVIVEESSMVDADPLHANLLKALPFPERTQFIFLGDLNQLPPIFGPSILGFKLTEQPTTELTHVYRQALESPIITLAHRIREGRGFKGKLEDLWVDDRGEHGKVTIKPWKKRIDKMPACKVALANFVIPLVTSPDYDFEQNQILCPYNQSFGTIELNKAIADALAKKRDALVYEVVARYTKSYWAVGDRVLVDRREAIITKIDVTPGYNGPIPEAPSKTLDRWGRDPEHDRHKPVEDKELQKLKGLEMLDSLVVGAEGEETKNAASHTITVEFVDTVTTKQLSTAGEINAMLFSYVLTVHKSQGSEWKRVFILLHYSHNTMLSRELLYTAVTRAKHELFIICEPDRGEVYNSITRAAKSPEIHGVTLEEKAAYFRRVKQQRRKIGEDQEEQREDSNGITEIEGE